MFIPSERSWTYRSSTEFVISVATLTIYLSKPQENSVTLLLPLGSVWLYRVGGRAKLLIEKPAIHDLQKAQMDILYFSYNF